MRPRPDRARSDRTRLAIASAAARLLAEDGVDSYAEAKRKALRQLNLPETTALPTNAEVEAALRTWQTVFQGDEQGERIRELRQTAVKIMEKMQAFHPYLTGSVLDGTAGRYADIDLLLFADSAKEVEIFLLDQRMAYRHTVPHSERVEAVLTVDAGSAHANLVIFPASEERQTHRGHDGRPRERARLDAVRALLAEPA